MAQNKKGEKRKREDENLSTALLREAETGNTLEVKRLLEQKASLDARDSDGWIS